MNPQVPPIPVGGTMFRVTDSNFMPQGSTPGSLALAAQWFLVRLEEFKGAGELSEVTISPEAVHIFTTNETWALGHHVETESIGVEVPCEVFFSDEFPGPWLEAERVRTEALYAEQLLKESDAGLKALEVEERRKLAELQAKYTTQPLP